QDWSQGDFTYTGHTGTQDFGLWFNGYVASLNGTHGPTTQDASLGGVGTMSPSGITATPEPGTICLLGAGMAALGVFAARRRWPRRPTH
ncbi:MAG: PEP-CTERM sorting domain-containing protein, partial [Thermoguttaceae bacterium]